MTPIVVFGLGLCLLLAGVLLGAELQQRIRLGCYTDDGEPILCPRCLGPDLRETTTGIDGNVVSELRVTCRTCDLIVGHWAYGAWDPSYREGTV